MPSVPFEDFPPDSHQEPSGESKHSSPASDTNQNARSVEGTLLLGSGVTGLKRGRPTDYRPEFPEMLLEYFTRHRSLRQVVEVDQATVTEAVVGEDGKVLTPGKGSRKQDVRYICGELPTIEGFGMEIGIARVTMFKWIERYPEFAAAYARAKDIQTHLLIDRGLTGQYNPQAFIFVARNITYMKDRLEIPEDKKLDTPTQMKSIEQSELEAAQRQLMELVQKFEAVQPGK